jgi:uncharacterized protein YndB with AHSA1/START domain
MKGTLHPQGKRLTVRFEPRLTHPPEKVWRALTDNAELVHWFPAQIRGERQQGAKLRFVFKKEGGPEMDSEMSASVTAAQESYESREAEGVMQGELTVYEPPRTLEYTWGGELLRWELQARNGETLLVFTHTFDDAAKAAGDAAGWEVCLGALERRLAGLQPEPLTQEKMNVLVNDYSRRFEPTAAAKP